jgi:hypothetical protein
MNTFDLQSKARVREEVRGRGGEMEWLNLSQDRDLARHVKVLAIHLVRSLEEGLVRRDGLLC